MLVVHATFPVDPEKREEVLDLIADLAEQSRTEDGVVDYRAGTDVEDPNAVRESERYEDERPSAPTLRPSTSWNSRKPCLTCSRANPRSPGST